MIACDIIPWLSKDYNYKSVAFSVILFYDIQVKEAIELSDPKLISPLLDGFIMGSPMSSHNGVQCCPAIKENSEEKYIVKIISVPASQVQMDALLLAGAYRDPADAMDYFNEVAEGVVKEAEFLRELSGKEGFLSYDSWQLEPITSKRLGYQVYLVGSYKRSLEKHVRRSPVTHLEAMNVGLDMCDALALCRQAGALYVDLKPTNIFMSEKKEYRIGDLGFIQMDALKYTALPEKYRSVYTPPELHDPMASLNLTADTYAVGMILYQLYNDGQLSFRDKAPEEALPSPANADYELAEIIMKAIHPDPQQRWDDPSEMGKALKSYMQKNVINDTPITPHTALNPDLQQTMVFQAITQEALEKVPAAVGAPSEAEEAKNPEAAPENPPAADEESHEDASEEKEDAPADETLPGDADAETLLPHQMSDELSRMMAKADDLLAHETPEGVVVPELPQKPDPFAFVAKNFDDVDDTDVPFDPVMEEETQHKYSLDQKTRGRFASQEGKKRLKRILSSLFGIAIAAGICFACFWFYQNVYLQKIESIVISGDRSHLTVHVETEIDPSLLTVTCSDNYGNVMDGTLTDGKVSFQDLLPNTMYKVELEINGFHGLVGQTSEVFTTDTTTSIITFTAVTGPEDGSVMLNFTVDGDEPDAWTLRYSAKGEEEMVKTFTGHSITLKDLAVSKFYTFTLEAGDDLSLSGKTSLEYMVSRLILAQDLTITSNGAGDMTVHWNTPGDIVVSSWNVRCYNDSGYEEQVTVSDTQVSFTGIDPSQSYTVEVTAAGMTQPARTGITADPINITSFQVDESKPDHLTLSWEHAGEPPIGGWLVMYTIDGSDSSTVAKSDKASAVISPRIPGAQYQFTVQAADATSIFGNVYTYDCPESEGFVTDDLTSKDISSVLVKTPEKVGWTFDMLDETAVSDTFAVGDKISIVLQAGKRFYLPGHLMKVLFVVEDAQGNVLPSLVAEKNQNWKDLWYSGDTQCGELDIPKIPAIAGDYTVKVYFNGELVTSADFSIS